jgi:hypothetical protein
MMFDMMIDKAMAKAAQKASGGDMSQAVRLELRELKKAVFVNASDGNAAYTQDTQDYMDRADTGWDAILKLAAEQTPVDGLSVPRHPAKSTSTAAAKYPLTGEEMDEAHRQLMFTQGEQEAEQTEEWIAAKATVKADAKKRRLEIRKGCLYVCPRMKAGRRCDGTKCTDSGNGSGGSGGSSGGSASGGNASGGSKFHHPPVCKNPLHENVPKSEREGCVMWHFWAHHPNANRGSKGNGSKFIRNKNDNGSGNPRKAATDAAKEIAHLKRAAANQVVELAKANERAKVYRQVSAVSYSATASSQAQAPPPAPPYPAPPYPPAGSQVSAATGRQAPHRPGGPPPHRPGTPDLATVLLMLEGRMAAMETRFLAATT